MNLTPNTERAIVGCLLDNPELAFEVNSSWMTDLRVESAVQAIQKMMVDGDSVDFVAVQKRLTFPDAKTFLLDCVAQCVSGHNFPMWRDELRFEYRKRTLKGATEQFLAKLPAANGNLPDMISALESELDANGEDLERNTIATGKQAAIKLTDALEARMNCADRTSGLATGYPDIDYITDGIQLGESTIVGARPSIGKTAFALNLVEKICIGGGVPTLFITLEMSDVALLRRLLSSVKKIPMRQLRSGRFAESDFPPMTTFAAQVANSPLFIKEQLDGMTASEVGMLVRRMKRKHGIKLVVLDYLQKLNPEARHEKRTYEVAEGSKKLKAIARQNGVAMLVIAQLNRESERDKGRAPRASDLADSGQIERDADNILLLHRDRSKNEHEAKLMVVKQRDGETGVVDLYFNGKYCRFESATRDDHECRNPTND